MFNGFQPINAVILVAIIIGILAAVSVAVYIGVRAARRNR